MISSKYKNLSKELNSLEKHLISKRLVVGNYTSRQKVLIMSFIVLTHAKIEEYFESYGLEIINEASKKWKNKRTIPLSILSLVAYYGYRLPDIPTKIILHQNELSKNIISLEERIEKVVNYYNSDIRVLNHGIKETNLLRILLPLGVRVEDFDATWISTVETFSSLRGEAAHKGFVKNEFNHLDILENVKKIKEGIKSLDKVISLIK